MYFDLQFTCDITLKMPGHMQSASFRLIQPDRTVFLFNCNVNYKTPSYIQGVSINLSR